MHLLSSGSGSAFPTSVPVQVLSSPDTLSTLRFLLGSSWAFSRGPAKATGTTRQPNLSNHLQRTPATYLLAIVSTNLSALSSQHYAFAFVQSDSTSRQSHLRQSTVHPHQPHHRFHPWHQPRSQNTSVAQRNQLSASRRRTYSTKKWSCHSVRVTAANLLHLAKMSDSYIQRRCTGTGVQHSSTTCAIPSTPRNDTPMPSQFTQSASQPSTRKRASDIASPPTSSNLHILPLQTQPNTNHLT